MEFVRHLLSSSSHATLDESSQRANHPKCRKHRRASCRRGVIQRERPWLLSQRNQGLRLVVLTHTLSVSNRLQVYRHVSLPSMKGGTASGSQIPKPVEYNNALPSTTQSGGNQTPTIVRSPEKQPRIQKTEPLRSSSATYIPANAESSSGKENSGVRIMNDNRPVMPPSTNAPNANGPSGGNSEPAVSSQRRGNRGGRRGKGSWYRGRRGRGGYRGGAAGTQTG